MIWECIPDYREIDLWMKLASENNLAFEYNEFFSPQVLDDKALMEDIIRCYQSTGRKLELDTLHGAFLDICVNSTDSLIRKASWYRVEQGLDIACRMGLRGVVFHTNYISGFKLERYRKEWIEKNIEFWGKMCGKYPQTDIYLENMFDESPQLLTAVAEGLKAVENFGVCLDIAHSSLSDTGIDDFLNNLEPHIRHVHINDTEGLEDSHLAVGAGVIDWNVLKDRRITANNPSILIEVRGADKVLQSLDYLKSVDLF